MNVIEVKNLKKTFISNKKYKGKEKWKHLFKKEKVVKNTVDDIVDTDKIQEIFCE